jgi:hypothetical protein
VEWFLAMAGARETETEATMEGRKWRARGREKISGGGRREQRIHGNNGALPNASLGGVYGLGAEEDLESRLETKSSFTPLFLQ